MSYYLYLFRVVKIISVPTPASRNYQQDAAVLNEFVDINKTTHEYYINSNKRNSVLSYITNVDVEELNSINSLNLSIFKESINQVNSRCGQLAAPSWRSRLYCDDNRK